MPIQVPKTALVVMVALATIVGLSFSVTRPVKDLPKMRGVCWVGGDSVAAHNLDELAENHIEWISQTPFGWQPRYDAPEIQFGSDAWYWGERDAGIIHTTKLAHERGVKVVLKPHLWLRRSGGKWRSDIEMQSDEDWETWFCKYTDMLLHYARLAEQCNIEMYCIGTELLIPATRYPDRWREMISQVRDVYSGKLTYAANFYKEFEEVTWWDELDFIGIQGYFPLCTDESPDLDALKKGWEPHLKSMRDISKRYKRPVIFTEIGYRNDPKAASEPWLWPNQLDEHSIQVDDKLQARCYEAFFETCWDQEWFAGVFFWKWFHSTWKHDDYNDYLTARNRIRDSLVQIGEYPSYYHRRKIYFTPQGREAQVVMREYFKESITDK